MSLPMFPLWDDNNREENQRDHRLDDFAVSDVAWTGCDRLDYEDDTCLCASCQLRGRAIVYGRTRYSDEQEWVNRLKRWHRLGERRAALLPSPRVWRIPFLLVLVLAPLTTLVLLVGLSILLGLGSMSVTAIVGAWVLGALALGVLVFVLDQLL